MISWNQAENQAEKEDEGVYLEVRSPRRLGNTKANRAVVTLHSGNITLLAVIQRLDTCPPCSSLTTFRIFAPLTANSAIPLYL